MLAWDLNRDAGLTGHRRDDPYTLSPQHAGDVVRNARNFCGFRSCGRFIFQRRDDRAHRHVGDLAFIVEIMVLYFDLLYQDAEVGFGLYVGLAGWKYV